MAHQTTGSCAVSWGTGTKAVSRADGPATAKTRNVRAGEHRCYDRLVIDLGHGQQPGYRVRYVSQVVSGGSGNPIPLRGKAQLLVTVNDNAVASYPAGAANLVSVSGFPVLRQVAGAGSFEGVTDIGVGVKGKRPFRVRLLPGPGRDSRLVIDVAHHR
jgi:hypothetical protein